MSRLPKGLAASRAQEKQGAAAIGGTVNSGSGNGVWRKNDIRNDNWSMELKYTDAGSYRLHVAELENAERHALMDNGRSMAFGVSFSGRQYFVISEAEFMTLIGAA